MISTYSAEVKPFCSINILSFYNFPVFRRREKLSCVNSSERKQSRAEQSRAEQSRAEQSRAEQTSSDNHLAEFLLSFNQLYS